MKLKAIKRVLNIALLGGMVLLFTGCWDAEEVQRLNYIIGMGVDYEDNKFIIYGQMVNFSSIAKQEQQNATVKNWVGRGKGTTVLAAFSDLIASGQGTMFLGHIHYLILSENVLKEQMLEKVFDFTNRNKETRYTKWFYGTKDSMFDILSTKSFFDRSSLDSILGNPEQNYAQLSNLKPYYVNEVVAAMLEPSSTVTIPSVEITKETWMEQRKPADILKKSGGFIFNGTQYLGWMKMSDIMQGRWMQAAYEASPLTLRSGNGIIATLEVKNASHKIEIVDRSSAVPRFKIKLKATGTLMELAEEKPLEELQRLAEQTIRKEIQEYYKKGLAMHADLLHLGQTLYIQNPSKWRSINVNGQYPLTPDSLEGVEVHLIINHAQKYKSPQLSDTYK
ncbi:Ger(x)C family spore germination protein [Paenibacillus thalictri]|uniref:Ger(X)C family spore germination protein n=1 Tax=Paenibacillus thalictri TaxID=2527873 RepID=A0A4Q9DXK4_9BACL|nr:Ger(x)C family spore germination protein [Paenibacillus thalictri]TBL80583.1 Ger(x)C family spore germination protein [Paenibacillus thalictri]